ncbi:carboxylesterase family domain-containing protein [Phthorimaea operculella]|nr:carboxylesterase family domain-containing protein [Phthorimaea operculella]
MSAFSKETFRLLIVLLNILAVLADRGRWSRDKTLIDTTTGPVKGTVENSYGVEYYAFQGIPYAEKPMRFKPPVPKKPWKEPLQASFPGRVCPQSEGAYKKEEMDEDCLFLNVFVPANSVNKGHRRRHSFVRRFLGRLLGRNRGNRRNEPLPVLVWIHGGEFKTRSGNGNDLYGPPFMIRHDIVFVTLNYRLGALGFLSLEDKEARGNNGLKDILLALKWINENIDRFGGDSSKITIAGNSAGSVATHFLLLSEKSKGLFHQAGLVSGSALGFRFLTMHPRVNGVALAKEMGTDSNSTSEILKKLTEADFYDIVKAQEAIGRNDRRKGFRPFAPFVPCIEAEHEDAVITKDPREIIQSGIPNNVPILAGFNSHEGLKMYPAVTKNRTLIDFLNEDFQRCIPTEIAYPKDSVESKDLAKSIKKFYFDGADISDDNLQQFVNLITDTMFAHSIDYWIKLHKENKNSKVLYDYVFGFDGKLNWFKVSNKLDKPGTSHGDELGYLFVTNATKPMLEDLDERSERMRDTMTEMISNFVKFGNPTPEDSDIETVWKESGKDRNHLYIDEELKNVEGRPIPERMQFWDEVYEKFYKYVKDGGKVEYSPVP